MNEPHDLDPEGFGNPLPGRIRPPQDSDMIPVPRQILEAMANMSNALAKRNQQLPEE